MTVPRRPVLERVVATYDRKERPVSPADIAPASCDDHAALGDCLESLVDLELLEAVGRDRFRPTVTARELLALDVDGDGPVVVDPDGEC